jgi:uncharacterized membrane protein YkoI
MRLSATLLLTVSLAAPGFAAESRIKRKNLPPAVEKVVQQEEKNGTLKGLSKETEDGRVAYEIETVVNGRTRDLLVDAAGSVIEVEQEVPLDSIPAAAREAIQKKAAGAKIRSVELLTKGSATSYEAHLARGLKHTEVIVNPDGSPGK